MASQTEGQHAAEFLLSEAAGSRSREKVTLTSGENLEGGAVLALVSGKYIEYDNDASAAAGGVASAILLEDSDASAADLEVAVIARDAEVNRSKLKYNAGMSAGDQTAAETDLATVGIIVRAGV
jgi:hypothetical protein